MLRNMLLTMVLATPSCLNENSCVNQTVTPTPVVVPGGSPSPVVVGGVCPAADRLQPMLLGNGTPVVKVGSVETVDVLATASGQEIKGDCAAAKTVVWDAWVGPCAWSGGAVTGVGFTPQFRGSAAGTCRTNVNLDGKSAAFSVQVEP